MAKIGENIKFVYMSRTRYPAPEYPYKIAVEDRGIELVIHHLGIIGGEWRTTHSIGITRKDLSRVVNKINTH